MTQPPTSPIPFPGGLDKEQQQRGRAVNDLIRGGHGKMSVRLRLTLWYGGLFFVAGAVLLVAMYVTVSAILGDALSNLVLRSPLGDTPIAPSDESKQQVIDVILDSLIGRSVIALLVIGVVALLLGYVVADRALRPLQTVTATARSLSSRSLAHERIGLAGPDDEIKELADTFDAMLSRLNDAFDTQRRFVANASHELRTPLTVNRTVLEVALGDPETSEDLRALGRTLLGNNARHERLIDGLLLLAQSERELTTRKSVDLGEVVRTVLDQVESGDVVIEADTSPAPASGDPVLLERLVFNLVENAVKHNNDEKRVWVRTLSDGPFPVLQVANTGQVVPAYEVETLFEPFRRLHADRVESARGAGLGLSIVRAVARAHGGTAVAMPRDGGGLVITVRLAPAS